MDPLEPLPQLWRALDLKPAAQPRHLAKGRLIRAAINLLVGDEGIGKSLLWVWIVAAITTGRALPEFGIPARAPQYVVVVITEDAWTDTVLPRMIVAGVDLAYVMVICTEDDGSGSPIFPADMHLVTEADPAPALVVVDAWLDTVPSGLSVRDPQQARRALHPWKEAATATDAAVLLLTHTNRVDTGNARDKYGATGELRKKARLTLFAQQDDDGHLVVGVEKANTTTALPASMFDITPVQHFDATDDHDGTVPLLRYIGESDRTARDHIVDAHEGEHGDTRTARTECEGWVSDYLTVEGPSLSRVVKQAGLKVGHKERTIERAAKAIRVVVESRGFPRQTYWSLASQGNVVDGEVVSDATATNPVSQERGATGATGSDLRVRSGATDEDSQSRQTQNDGATGGATVRPTACSGCHITLPATAATDVCDECDDPTHRVRETPPPRPLTVVHDGRARARTGQVCPHCDDPLIYADDIRDGYHTSITACVRAHRKEPA